MKYCIIEKKDSNQVKIIPVIKEVFEKETDKREPFFQNINCKKYAFAKCPACENPVQIIGFYRITDSAIMDHAKEPYARHYAKDIHDIALHNQQTYEVCPYHKKRYYNRNEKRPLENYMTRKIKERFIKHFDKIVYILKKDTGIHYGAGLLRSMLKSYCAWDAWLYMGATLENIPWVFAYMSDNQNLFGQYIEKDGFLYKELKKKKYGIIFETKENLVQIKGFSKPLQSLRYFYTDHKSTPESGMLNESITMIVSLDDNQTGISEKIIEKKISFDHKYFFHLLHYETWEKDEKKLALVREYIKIQ